MGEYVGGADECGTGSYAGPALVCLVLAPVDWALPEVKDSKSFKGKRDGAHLKRSEVYDRIVAQAPFIQWFVEWVWPETIDRDGLGRSVRRAFETVVRKARDVQPDAEIIIDGNVQLRNFQNIRSFPKADTMVQTVSAASIIAKVERDRWMMTEADSEFPEYGFINHVGYGTEEHQTNLEKYGPCRLHRKSFKSVAKVIESRAGTPLKDLTPEEVPF